MAEDPFDEVEADVTHVPDQVGEPTESSGELIERRAPEVRLAQAVLHQAITDLAHKDGWYANDSARAFCCSPDPGWRWIRRYWLYVRTRQTELIDRHERALSAFARALVERPRTARAAAIRTLRDGPASGPTARR